VEAEKVSAARARRVPARRITRADALRLMGITAGMLAGPGLAMVGCGGNAGLVAIDRIGREDAPNSLKVQLNNSYTHQSSTPSWADGFEKLFTKFAKNHANWQLQLKIIPDDQTTQEQARLLEEARVGRAPAWANVDSFVVAQFIQQGALKPIDQFFSKAEIDGLFPFVRDIVVGDDGKMYAYWWATDVRVLYRRTDLVPEPPRTWDDLIKAAKAAKQKDSKVDGYLFNGGRWEGTVFDNLAHFWSQGGELVDTQGKPNFGEQPNRTYMLNVFEFLKECVDSGASPQRVATIKDYSDFEAGAQASTVAMFQGGDFQYPPLKDTLPPEEFKKWDISLIPTMNPGDPQKTGTGGWTMGAFTDDSEKLKTGMDFTKEVYIGEGNQVTGQLPTNPKFFDTLQKFQEPVYDKFREALKFGQARPGVPVYPEISNQLQIAIGTVLTGESSPEQALDRAYQSSLSAYQEQQK
jgi:multiple sugar transport system substrate-binding protein